MDIVSSRYCVSGIVSLWAENELEDDRVTLNSSGRILVILDCDDLLANASCMHPVNGEGTL